jgi:hypothetical protein
VFLRAARHALDGNADPTERDRGENMQQVRGTASEKLRTRLQGETEMSAAKWAPIDMQRTYLLNGIVYDDDKQIVKCIVSKNYSTTPQVFVSILET